MNVKSAKPQLEMDMAPHHRVSPLYIEPQAGLSPEVRRLENKWLNGQGWPKRLEYIELNGIRGWEHLRMDFRFPIVAIVGENGAGKSTVIQCAASVYEGGKAGHYPSDFLPDTPWEVVEGATISYSFREGDTHDIRTLQKLKRWRGYDRRPKRHVQYIDLSRVQPVSARTGYQRLANPKLIEDKKKSEIWDAKLVKRLSHLMGREYQQIRMSAVQGDKDPERRVPILQVAGRKQSSGFHNGQGETTMAELIKKPMIPTSLVLIDEIETSLHPKVQRKLIRDLAHLAAINDLQIILTTHSPYILEELPPMARIYIMNEPSGRTVMNGVSPEFAMTRMDDYQHPECDVYTEDKRSAELIKSILAERRPELFPRCLPVPYGAAHVGYALGTMVAKGRFPRPSVVFIDGDQTGREGTNVLPGDDAPERVVFEGLRHVQWKGLDVQLGRSPSEVIDSCGAAMTSTNPKDWVRLTADRLLVGGEILWHAMTVAWVRACMTDDQADQVIRPIADALRA
jgi:predicted ATPase